jgi:hypothetical protein
VSDEIDEELRREMARLRQSARERALAEFDPQILCRASLLPQWTRSLASELDLVTPGEYQRLVDRLVRAGLVEHGIHSVTAGLPQEAFWVRDRYRREIGDHLQTRLGSGLRVEYDRFCRMVDGLHSDDPNLRLWLSVRGFQEDPSGRRLMDRVESLLADGDVPTAATTIAAARVVGDVIGGTLENAVTRAQWRLDREYRTRDDLDYLRGYFRRTQIEESLRDLVTGDDDQWALHMKGDAGVGKTMVLRYLASGQFAENHGLSPFPVARIDFDHLDPRYPEQRPVELLVALTDQLVGFASSRDTERYFRSVHDVAQLLHEEFAKPEPNGERAAMLIQDAIQRFVKLVQGIASPVVLVLDTCEELAKLYAPGVSAPAIDRTFELIEDLHARVPSVRVVFAGRRGLIPSKEERGGPVLHGRPYLSVLRISGFTRGEAEQFMDSRAVPDEFRLAVLERSGIRGTGLHNPFDLETYCSWISTDPTVDAEELLNAPGDPYIERRIIGRMDSATASVLPVAVALGSFDRDLVRPALRRLDVDPDAVFDGLAGHEWVRVRQIGPDGRPRVIELDDHIRERMRRVFQDSHQVDEHQLGRDAAAVIRENPLGDVATETAVAAMRLLPLAEASELWDEIDSRVLESGDWGWAMQITPRVAAVEALRDGRNLLAAVHATQASALVHTWRPGVHFGRGGSLEALWSEVFKHSMLDPVHGRRSALVVRSSLGLIAAGDDVTQEHWDELTSWAANQSGCDAALVAAVDTLVGDWPPSVDVSSALESLAGHEVPQMAANALISKCGLLLRGGHLLGAGDAAVRAVELMESAPPAPRWRDWVPRGLLDRARLMRILVALRGGDPVDEKVWQRWRTDAMERLHDADADRLVAATLDYEMCFRIPRAPLPQPRPSHEVSGTTNWLHFGLGRPLFVAAADAIAAQGAPDEAAELIIRERNFTTHQAEDPRTIACCELALLRLCRRHGTTRFTAVQRLAEEGSARVRDEAWLVLKLVEGVEPNPAKLGSAYGRWRCAPDTLPPDKVDWLAADHLDHWESAVLTSGSHWLSEVPDASRAQGVAAMLAGNVRGLGSPESGEALLRYAAERFTDCEDDENAEFALFLAFRFEVIARMTAEPEHEPKPATPMSVSRGGVLVGIRDFLHSARMRGSKITKFGVFLGLSLGLAAALLFFLLAGYTFTPAVMWLSGASFVLVTAWIMLTSPDLEPIERIKIRRSSSGQVDIRTGRSLSLDDLELRGVRLAELARVLANPLLIGRYRLPGRKPPAPLGDVDVHLARPIGWATPNPIALDIERDLQELAWEQWIGRVEPVRRTRPQVLRLWGGHRLKLPDAEWATAGTAFHGPDHLQPRPTDEQGSIRRLFHVVGTPVTTSAGTHIRVRHGRGTGSLPENSRWAVGREDLLNLDDVTATPTVMAVFQAEPVDRGPVPLDEMRAEFIRCALTVKENGVDIALIIPPLTDELAQQVSQLVWAKVADSERVPTVMQVVRLCGEIRRLIAAEESAAEGADLAELDVILFYRGRNLMESET